MQELLSIFSGIVLGIFTGLTPGIHLNTVALFLLSLNPQNSTSFLLLVVSMAVTHSFMDFIPSILIGAPDSESFLSILPGHKFFLQGKAHFAVMLSGIGCFFGVFFAVSFIPVFVLFFEKTKHLMHYLIPAVLVIVLFLMVFSEKTFEKRIWALLVMVFSGILGLVVLENSLSPNPLLPLITGFFASSSLIWSLKQKTPTVKQQIACFNFPKLSALKFSFFGSLAGSLVSVFPSIGPAQAAFVLRKFISKLSSTQYLVVLGSISSSNIVFSFFSLYFFSKTRSGAAVAVSQLMQLSFQHLILIIITVIFSAGVSFLLLSILSKQLVFLVQKLNYQKLSLAVLAFLFAIVFFLSGIIGLFIFVIASFLGLLPLLKNLKRTHTMSFLIFPTLAYYLAFLML